MVMTERYGVPSTKIIAFMKYLQTPLQQIQEGDKPARAHGSRQRVENTWTIKFRRKQHVIN